MSRSQCPRPRGTSRLLRGARAAGDDLLLQHTPGPWRSGDAHRPAALPHGFGQGDVARQSRDGRPCNGDPLLTQGALPSPALPQLTGAQHRQGPGGGAACTGVLSPRINTSLAAHGPCESRAVNFHLSAN